MAMQVCPELAVCIATYRRPAQLRRIIENVVTQNLCPGTLVIVDGDPASGEVTRCLAGCGFPGGVVTHYVPSNHASLPYQRYLAWRTAESSRWLLYLDDDLRISDPDFIAKVIHPLNSQAQPAAGVTCPITFGDPPPGFQTAVYELTARGPRFWRRLFNLGRTPKGGVSPTGHRRMPADAGTGYEPVEWLSGGVMAVRTSALNEDCFPETGFALFRSRLGTGEDLVLARHVRQAGPLMMAFCTSIHHPSEVPTIFGPQSYFPLGLTMAYGERFVNDHFRGTQRPTSWDRLFLLRSLAGTCVLNWVRAVRRPALRAFVYSAGFSAGTMRALFHFPGASELTPGIDWKRDAEIALQNASLVSGSTNYEIAGRTP